MMTEEPGKPGVARGEFVAAVLLLAAMIGAQMLATGGGTLLHRLPWLDEVHSAILVNEPDRERFRHAMSDRCVDLNFPVYYQMFRWARATSLEAMRAASLVATGLALLGVYLLLRGSFDRIESAVGALTVWATPLVVYHAIQARFYAPWFAAVVWFAVLLRWEKVARRWWVAATALAAVSALACTLHGFGLPAIAMIAAADLWFDRRPIRLRLRDAAPALAGPIAVAAFIPLLIAQRQSYPISSWLVGNPGRLFYSTLTGILPGVAAAVLLLAVLISTWIGRRESARRELTPLAGLCSLLLFPLVLLVISLTSQPALLSRYALISVAAFAPAAALAATHMRRSMAIAVCLCLVGESGAELVRQARQARKFDGEITGLVQAIRAQPDVPALFESRHQLFPVVWTAPDLTDRCAYVDFEPGPNQLDPIVEGFERDTARKFEQVFGRPRVMPWETVIALPRFILIPLDDDPDRVQKRFADFNVERIRDNRYELSRATGYKPVSAR